MIRFEFEAPRESLCACCQNTTVKLTRFVYQDDNAFAVYYAQFTPGHGEKRLSGMIGLGVWGDDTAGPESRLAFPFEIWLNGDNFQVGLSDAADSPWSGVTYLGRILDREEALRHPWRADVFHITDHMVSTDPDVVKYFS